MNSMYSILLRVLVNEFSLEIVYQASDYEKIRLTMEDVSRPGLQLAGYFYHFEPMRLQVMGNVEVSYLEKLSEADRAITFDRLLSYKIAALAPRITRHAVLMEVYGEGLLLMGESGMGKSEAAIELLKRGHRMIADDAVEIRKVSGETLMGTAPELVRNYVELRGIGIINVAKLFGMGAVKVENEVNLIVNVVPWDHHASYDRLGLEDQYTELLGVKVPTYTIPITPGRNLAVILEVAAMNNRQRKMGYNPAKEFTEQMNRHFMEDAN